MPDFQVRANQEEIMDDLQAGGFDLEQSLRELAFINRWSGGQRVLFDALHQLKPTLQTFHRPVKIMDIACGGGDLLARIDEWAKYRDLAVTPEGIDANPHVIAFAQNQPENAGIQFSTEDLFNEDFQNRTFDIALLTLFCHHLTDEELIEALEQLKGQTTTAIIINDLHRHPVPYYFTKITANLFSKTPMVKNDGPLSVLRGFKRSELAAILSKAGIGNFQIRWFWAFRWQIIIWPAQY